MNKGEKLAITALIFQVLEFLLFSWQFIVTTAWVYLICILFIIVSSIFIFLICIKHYKVLDYVKFIEYLMNNEKHNFVLLPKIKMYIHNYKISNYIKIKNLNIEYDITYNKPSEEENEDLILGDMLIKYDIFIENKNIPNDFNFVSGNDYSNFSPNVKYRYGSRNDYQPMSENHELVAPYWRGSLKHYSFGFERRFIPQEGDLKVEIIVSCDKAFIFRTIPRDTIICLPEIFSKSIERIDYKINLKDFDDKKFYCDAYQIYSEKRKYTTRQLGCEKEPNNQSFSSVLFPNKIKSEKAYYFRVGMDKSDKEIRN